MTHSANIERTKGHSVTESLPERRRSPNYPFAYIDPPSQPEHYIPRRPEPTFTIWKQPDIDLPIGEVVYFVYCAGRIKIGITFSISKRLETIRAHSPHPVIALLLVPGGIKEEREFHARFAAERKHGEWFILSQKMRNFFKARLCPVGRASLRNAESEFDNYCKVERP